MLLLCGRENPIIVDTLAKMQADETYRDTRLYRLTQPVFDKLCDEKSPDGVITVIKCLDNFGKVYKIERNDAEAMRGEKLMLLASVRDPGNLGTIVRSAAAFGFDRLILSDDCADLYHPRTLRGAMGALFRQPVLTCATDELMQLLRANCLKLYGAALTDAAQDLRRVPLSPAAVAIGSEGRGLSAQLLAQCDGQIIIPMQPGAESLNAAVAAAVVMWEIARTGM